MKEVVRVVEGIVKDNRRNSIQFGCVKGLKAFQMAEAEGQRRRKSG